MESLIVEGEARCRGHLLDNGRVVEQTRTMMEHGDRSALASERCLRHSLGDDYRVPGRIDHRLSPLDRIGEPKRGVAQDTTEHLLEPTGRRRFPELDDKPCHQRAGPTSEEPGPGYRETNGAERGSLGEPQPGPERAGPDDTRCDALSGGRENQEEVRTAGDQDRSREAPDRAAGSQEPPERESDECRGPSHQ